jgi:hypothetical protein
MRGKSATSTGSAKRRTKPKPANKPWNPQTQYPISLTLPAYTTPSLNTMLGRNHWILTTRYGSRPLDVDNGAGGCKPLLDAIRYEGLIPDDDPTTIDFIFRQYQVKKPYRNTHVLIERVE